ncbi:reticulon-3-like isoform X6 [Oncorhynchus clarkii lewisi]|uniref:reticulon-3-like isoform X6 n=1 Tax=Oncorhynchus clarkii lewisi TaxID=490388 RepID=UPI0039B97524
MADSMTQSAQISSSQGLADGQNSVAAKDSKMSDSFLSSSPVSLIQSPEDKGVVLGSDTPSSEGVATSLRFTRPSQPGSSSSANYGSDPPDGKQDDSPTVTSPVSERIKALEAMAAKKELKNDGGFPHFKERHYDTSPTEAPTESTSPFQTKGASIDQESPESPFEVMGEARQGSEFEDTADWMRAHLPPVPDFEDALVSEEDGKSQAIKVADKVVPDDPEAFACVPDAFMDSPIERPELKNVFKDPAQQPSVEDEFDLSFLPKAYIADTQGPPDLHSELTASPAPPAGLDSPSPSSDSKEKDLKTKQAPWGGDLAHQGVVDSSGDSKDTVIEDTASIPGPSLSSDATPAHNPSVPSLPTEEKETPPAKQPMWVPTINVIETDEPNYSDEEMEIEMEDENYEVVEDPVKEAPKIPEPQPDVTKKEFSQIPPLEYEGYSPPSSPVDSDEYSPKHKILKSDLDTDNMKTTVPNDESKGSSAEVSQAQKVESDHSQIPNESNGKSSPSTAKSPEKTAENLSDFPEYDDDDWSTGAQDILIKLSSANVAAQDLPLCPSSKFEEKPESDIKEDYMQTVELSKPNYMEDDAIRKYDRQFFEDEDAFPSMNDTIDDKELNFNTVPEPSPSNPTSQIHIGTLLPQNNATTVEQDIPSMADVDSFPKPVGGQPSPREFPKDPFASFQSELPGSTLEPKTEKKLNDEILITDSVVNSKTLPAQEAEAGHQSPDNTSDPESIEPDCSVSGATDSFVEFMRECLKSRQDEDPEDLSQDLTAKDECPKTGAPPSQPTPTMVMDLEQERLTINALKELGSSQEEEADLQSSIKASEKSQSSFISTTSDPPSPQNKPASNGVYSKEVEAIDVWVAEAYHLAEHVLAAILTHLSVKDLVHWRDPKKSGVVFGLSLLTLLSLAAFSVISVVSYLLLALLCVTISFRIYKAVVQAVQKSDDGHPFKALMEKDVSVPPETFRKHVDASLTHINRLLKQLRKLFLVEDLIDSLKLAVVMWLLTYVGAVFNGITILILADILLFAVPPFYEKNKTQIDHYMEIARTQVNTTMAKLQEKLPGAIKRTKAE